VPFQKIGKSCGRALSVFGPGWGPRRTRALLLWPVVALIVAILVIRKASTVKDLAELISALAALGWPVIIVSIIYSFRPELRAFLSPLRKGKFLGTEFELDALQAKAVAAEQKADLPPISGSLSTTTGEFHLDATATVAVGRFDGLLDPDIRPPFREGCIWLVRPDGYAVCSTSNPGVVASYLDGHVQPSAR
jgi:hypothetical protein